MYDTSVHNIENARIWLRNKLEHLRAVEPQNGFIESVLHKQINHYERMIDILDEVYDNPAKSLMYIRDKNAYIRGFCKRVLEGK